MIKPTQLLDFALAPLTLLEGGFDSRSFDWTPRQSFPGQGPSMKFKPPVGQPLATIVKEV